MYDPISIPPELIEKIEAAASSQGVSVSEFVTQSLEAALLEDSLFADDQTHQDAGPEDVSANHDDYLYGDTF